MLSSCQSPTPPVCILQRRCTLLTPTSSHLNHSPSQRSTHVHLRSATSITNNMPHTTGMFKPHTHTAMPARQMLFIRSDVILALCQQGRLARRPRCCEPSC